MLPNRGRKLKQSLEIPILTHELYVFTRKDPCLGKERSVFQVSSRLQNIFCLNSAFLRSILVAKIISPVIFDTDHSFKRLNALFFTKNLFIEVFMMHHSHLVIFLLQGKVLCFAHVIKLLARCLSVGSVWSTLSKKFLVLFDSNCSFKTVKCSFFNQIIVFQSFYGAPLTFNYVLLQGKFLCFGTRRQVACEMFV